MPHKFNPARMHKLDNPERRKLLPPEKILELTGLKKGHTFLDIGAGTGYFSIPAAKIAGESGKVISADISPEMLDEIKSKNKNGIGNIEFHLSREEGLDLETGIADIVFMAFILHEINDVKGYMNEVRRVLKPGGKFAIVEWEKKETAAGPPLQERIGRDEAAQIIQNSGFSLIQTEILNQYAYFLLCSR